MSKKTLDECRFELRCYLVKAGLDNVDDFIDNYEKLLKLSEPVKYKHIGLLRIPLDIYNACKAVVPKDVLQRFENRLQHYLNTEKDINKIYKFRNNICEQFIDLYNEWSNVTTEEIRKYYN